MRRKRWDGAIGEGKSSWRQYSTTPCVRGRPEGWDALNGPGRRRCTGCRVANRRIFLACNLFLLRGMRVRHFWGRCLGTSCLVPGKPGFNISTSTRLVPSRINTRRGRRSLRGFPETQHGTADQLGNLSGLETDRHALKLRTRISG